MHSLISKLKTTNPQTLLLSGTFSPKVNTSGMRRECVGAEGWEEAGFPESTSPFLLL